MSPTAEELERRFDIFLANEPEGGHYSVNNQSLTNFCMDLAIIGYPFKPKPWMDERYLKPLISDELYYSGKLDDMLRDLLDYALTVSKTNNPKEK